MSRNQKGLKPTKMKFISLVILLFVFTTCVAQTKILSVQDAIDVALQKNYDIQLVRNEAEAYRIDNAYANGAFLPALNGSASKIWNKNSQKQNFTDGRKRSADTKSNNLNAAVNLDWTLFDGLKMFATKDRLAQLQAYGQLTLRTQVVNSIARVINNYFNIVRQKQLLRAIDTLIAINEERVQLADKKYSVGLGAKPELLQAKVDLNAQKAARLLQRTLITQLRQQLNQLTGMPVQEEYEVMDSIPINLELNYGTLVAGIDKTNPGLQAAKKTIDISSLAVKERKAERFPVVQFNSAYNFGKTNNGSVVNPEFQPIFSQNKGLNYGFSAIVPILNGFNSKRLIQQADLSVQYNKLVYDSTYARVQLNLSNSFKDYEYQKTALALEEDNISLAKENVFIALERFKQGVSTNLELRDAQISLQDAYNRLIAARYNAKLAETELLRLKGNL